MFGFASRLKKNSGVLTISFEHQNTSAQNNIKHQALHKHYHFDPNTHMCNRPKGENAEMGGLYDDFVPTVELAANALRAAAAAHQQTSNYCPPEGKQQYSQGYTSIPDEQIRVQESKVSQSPVSTMVTTPMQFSEQGNNFQTLGYPYVSPERQDDDDEYRPEDDDSEAYGVTRRRQSSHRSSRKRPTPDDPGWTAKHHRRRFVHHNYHDHAEDKEEGPLTGAGDIDSMSAKGGVITPFPLVLHNMLDSVEGEGFSHIVSWQPHGRAFCVHEPKDFVKRVMPIFFRQTKISSFQRQLNLYGFARLTNAGPDKGGYYNEYFLRGRPDLTVHMHRTRVKGTGVRTSSNPMEEPNFYEMPPVEDVNRSEQMKIEVPRPHLVSSLFPIHELRHSNDMMPIPNTEPSMSLSPRDIVDKSATGTSDMVDLDVKEMASFLDDVDLCSDEPAPYSMVFGHRVNLDHVPSTAV